MNSSWIPPKRRRALVDLSFFSLGNSGQFSSLVRCASSVQTKKNKNKNKKNIQDKFTRVLGKTEVVQGFFYLFLMVGMLFFVFTSLQFFLLFQTFFSERHCTISPQHTHTSSLSLCLSLSLSLLPRHCNPIRAGGNSHACFPEGMGGLVRRRSRRRKRRMTKPESRHFERTAVVCPPRECKTSSALNQQ